MDESGWLAGASSPPAPCADTWSPEGALAACPPRVQRAIRAVVDAKPVHPIIKE